MKKILSLSFVLIIVALVTVFAITTFSRCSITTERDLPHGVYFCETPYIKYTVNSNTQMTTQEIEIENEIHKTYTYHGYDGIISFNEDGKVLARFESNFNKKTQQLILINTDTKEKHYLDKIE